MDVELTKTHNYGIVFYTKSCIITEKDLTAMNRRKSIMQCGGLQKLLIIYMMYGELFCTVGGGEGLSKGNLTL